MGVDERIRDLERRARAGDAGAAVELVHRRLDDGSLEPWRVKLAAAFDPALGAAFEHDGVDLPFTFMDVAGLSPTDAAGFSVPKSDPDKLFGVVPAAEMPEVALRYGAAVLEATLKKASRSLLEHVRKEPERWSAYEKLRALQAWIESGLYYPRDGGRIRPEAANVFELLRLEDEGRERHRRYPDYGRATVPSRADDAASELLRLAVDLARDRDEVGLERVDEALDELDEQSEQIGTPSRRIVEQVRAQLVPWLVGFQSPPAPAVRRRTRNSGEDERKRELRRLVAAGDDEAVHELASLLHAESGPRKVWLVVHDAKNSYSQQPEPGYPRVSFHTSRGAARAAMAHEALRIAKLLVPALVNFDDQQWGKNVIGMMTSALGAGRFDDALEFFDELQGGRPFDEDEDEDEEEGQSSGRQGPGGIHDRENRVHSLEVTEVGIDLPAGHRPSILRRNPAGDEAERELRRRVGSGDDEAVKDLYLELVARGRLEGREEVWVVVQTVYAARRPGPRTKITTTRIFGAFSTQAAAARRAALVAKRSVDTSNAGGPEFRRQMDAFIADGRFDDALDFARSRLPWEGYAVFRVPLDEAEDERLHNGRRPVMGRQSSAPPGDPAELRRARTYGGHRGPRSPASRRPRG